MADRRHDKAKRLEALVTIEPGSLGAYALRYLEDLRVRNYSPHTVRTATVHLRLFLVWAEERGIKTPEALVLEILERYQRHLFHLATEDGRRLSFHSQYDRLGGLRRFCRWLARSRVLLGNPASALELPRVERRLPRNVLSAQEAERVLAQPDPTTPRGLRDRAILETLYATGIRRQEAVALAVGDVDLVALTLMVRQGKGKKDRLLPLSERAAAWIEKYLEEARFTLLRGRRDPHLLFVSRLGGGIEVGQLGKLVRTYVHAADIGKEGGAHLFRHTLATLMLDGGADLRYVQEMLGHADISTTQIYTRVAIRKLKEVYEKSHPATKLRRQRPVEDAGNGTDREADQAPGSEPQR